MKIFVEGLYCEKMTKILVNGQKNRLIRHCSLDQKAAISEDIAPFILSAFFDQIIPLPLR
ncbi:MAG TPA: hypothetical protein PLN40_07955 [Agitococcus sp.]|nr:hypothetical protein [Agitococcus sp.]